MSEDSDSNLLRIEYPATGTTEGGENPCRTIYGNQFMAKIDQHVKTLRYFVRCNSDGDVITNDAVPRVLVPLLDRLVSQRRSLRSSESDELSLDPQSPNAMQ